MIGCKGKKRTYGCEHVPWVEEEERSYKPEDVGREKGDDKCEKQLIVEKFADGEL